MSTTARPPAVAGTFYRGTAPRLRGAVWNMLQAAPSVGLSLDPRMVIVPHAGHIYSGPVAAVAYRIVGDVAPKRIALIGPSHFAAFDGLAAPEHAQLETPLGTIPVSSIIDDLERRGLVVRSEVAHRREHSLEVQLPFLQVLLDEFEVAPLLTGDEDPEQCSSALSLMLDAGFFGVVSSDLSHYLDHESAVRLDSETARSIVDLREADLDRYSACGRTAVRAALRVAADRGWSCALLDRRTSADTAGPPDRVVGYGAFTLGPDK